LLEKRWRLAIKQLTVYCLPDTVDPSPYASEKLLPSAVEVDDFAELYLVCPEQVVPQAALGRNKSLEPVSKSTDEEGQLCSVG
jgi:hypothetical protein